MRTIGLLITLTLAAWATGCGDALLGEVGLSEPLGLTPEPDPDAVSWEIRWFQGDGEGLLAPCELHASPGGIVADTVSLGYGYLDADGPDLDAITPAATIAAKTYSWSLGLALLVEADASSDRTTTSSEPLQGILGIAPFTVLLRVEGDEEAFTADLDVYFIDEDDGGVDAQGELVDGQLAWIDIDAFQAASTGSFFGSLFVFPEQGTDLVPVDSLDIAQSDILPLWSGDPLGGITFEACD